MPSWHRGRRGVCEKAYVCMSRAGKKQRFLGREPGLCFWAAWSRVSLQYWCCTRTTTVASSSAWRSCRGSYGAVLSRGPRKFLGVESLSDIDGHGGICGQAGGRAQEAMAQQATARLSRAEPGHDRTFRPHDMEVPHGAHKVREPRRRCLEVICWNYCHELSMSGCCCTSLRTIWTTTVAQ